MTEYVWAEEVESIAKDIIATVPEHEPLVHAQMKYVFRDKASRSRGRVTLGTARQVTGLNRFLVEDDGSGPMFVIEIAEDTWDKLELSQRYALVDHELSHVTVEQDEYGDFKGRTRGHDLEEFVGVVERHGLWKPDVVALATAAASKLEQLTLDLSTTDETADEATS